MRSRKKTVKKVNALIFIIPIVIVVAFAIYFISRQDRNFLTNEIQDDKAKETVESVKISEESIEKYDATSKYDFIKIDDLGAFNENDIDYKRRYAYNNLEFFYQYQLFKDKLIASDSEVNFEEPFRYIEEELGDTYIVSNTNLDTFSNISDIVNNPYTTDYKTDINNLLKELLDEDLSNYKNVIIYNLDSDVDVETYLYNHKMIASVINDKNENCKIYVATLEADEEHKITLKNYFKGQYIDIARFIDSYENSFYAIGSYIGFYARFLEIKNAEFINAKRITEDDIVDTDKKVVYMTFDDGPSSYTKELLDILDKNKVKATFFVTNNYTYSIPLIEREKKEGHSVGVHTYTHKYKLYESKETYFEDLYKMQCVVRKYTGEFTKLIRFPGGSANASSKRYNENIMKELVEDVQDLGYVYYDWNVSSGDGGETTREMALQRAKDGLSKPFKQHVILFHDIKKTTVDMIDEFIQYAKGRGYELMPLKEDSFICHQNIKENQN